MLERNMVGIQKTTQRTFVRKTTVFLCTLLSLFLFSAVYAYASTHTGITASIKTLLFETAISIGGFVAGLGGILFDIAINQLVLQMGDWFRYKGIGSVVTSMWTMIRDFFNILFIFSLVYIGLRTILDSDDSRTKKMLGMLIAAALLINFSLYIAKVIVDISNFTAVEIHEMATSKITSKDGGYGIKSNGGVNFLTEKNSLSGAYMEVLNVSSWFDDNLGNVPNTIAYSLFAMVFLMFLGFVLAYGALMLVARFIAIIFYLIFSPFMFLGWVLPQFQSYATKWWKGFLGYSFFAPVYILMLYIGLYSLQQIQNGFGETASFSYPFQTGSTFSMGTFEIFLMFAIGTGFLIAATKVAGMMSQGGAAIGMNMADKFSRKFAMNVGGRTGLRAAGGLLGGAAGASERVFGSTAMSRGLRGGRDNLRGLKIGGGSSIKDVEEAQRKGSAQVATDTSTRKFRKTMTSLAPKIKNGTATDEEKIKFESAIAGAKDAELIELAKTKPGINSIINAAGSLKDSQVEAILKSDDVDVGVKNKLKVARKEGVRTKIKDGGTMQTGLKDASTAQLASLDFKEDLMENAMYLQESQMDDLKKKWDDNETFRLLKEKRKTQLENAPADGKVGSVLRTRKGPKEIAKLPKEILEDATFALQAKSQGLMNVELLRKIATESRADKQTIRRNIQAAYPGGIPADIDGYFHSTQGVDYAL